MLWCLTSLAALVALTGLLALRAPAPRLHVPRTNMSSLLRGCFATACLLAAAALLGLILLVAR